MNKIDEHFVNDFSKEWKAYNQNELSTSELYELFMNYFEIFPFHLVNKNSVGFDMGFGSGRWAKLTVSMIKKLNCIEPSVKEINQPKNILKNHKNCIFLNYDVLDHLLEKNSKDFGCCLGVLHHFYDTKLGLKNCIDKLKTDAPFLLYFYYKFDNKPLWYKYIWVISNFFRKAISKLPFELKIFSNRFYSFYYILAFGESFIFSRKAWFKCL